MVLRKALIAVVAILSLLSISSAIAAEATPFAGTWVLDVGKSTGLSLPKNERRIYATSEDVNFLVTVEGVDATGEPYAYGASGDLDGRTYPMLELGKRTDGDAITWTRIDANTIDMKISSKGKTINLTRHAVSGDGKILTVSETLAGDGASSAIQVFAKQ